MNKLPLFKNYLYITTFLKGKFGASRKINFHNVSENNILQKIHKKNAKEQFFLNDWGTNNVSCEPNMDTFFFKNFIFETNENILSEKGKKKKLLFWNRAPGAKYPKKANNGARPDCRSLRKIRKRLKTGK